MPYITQNKRNQLDPLINQMRDELVKLATYDRDNNFEGNLNYIITRLIRLCYITSYANINDVIGMLECVKLEHYRTIAAPYEDQKCHDNGDVDNNIDMSRIGIQKL